MANILAGNNGVALGVASLPDQLLCPDKRKAVRDISRQKHQQRQQP